MKNKGFTLIELLAVITIMGILMLIAIPAVSRTIENSRKSTFANTALSYLNAVKKAVQEDQLVCNDAENRTSVISSKPAHNCDYFDFNNCYRWNQKPIYYYYFDSTQSSGQNLLESGGKSPWQSNEVKGIVYISKVDVNGTINYHYSMIMSDEAGYGFGYPGSWNVNGETVYIPTYIVQEKNITKNIVGKDNTRKTLYDNLTSNIYEKTYGTANYLDNLYLSSNGRTSYSNNLSYMKFYSCNLSI